MSPREAARARRPLDGADAQALEGALAGVERLLRELLAVVHGDGGQHAIRHGLEQSSAEAQAVVARLHSSRGLYEKAMDAIHDAAGVKRDGLAGILGWIDEARESNNMACENTPMRGCECPGCGYAREKAK